MLTAWLSAREDGENSPEDHDNIQIATLLGQQQSRGLSWHSSFGQQTWPMRQTLLQQAHTVHAALAGVNTTERVVRSAITQNTAVYHHNIKLSYSTQPHTTDATAHTAVQLHTLHALDSCPA